MMFDVSLGNVIASFIYYANSSMTVCSAVIQKITLSQLQVNNSFCSFVL